MKQYEYEGAVLTPGSTFVTSGPEGSFRHPTNWAHVWTSADYERWGVTVTDVDPPPPAVPTSVSPVQARLALAQMGILETVEAAIDAAGPATRIRWDYATEVRLNNPDLVALAAQLGITEQLPALFTLAATL